jgi:Icc-related predicted phosphoesterase
MRVLLVSDLHYDLRKFDWIAARLAEADSTTDVLVVAGDLLNIASSVPLDTQITVVSTYLARFARFVPTLVCSGNHDLDHRRASGEKATRWLTELRADGLFVDGDSFDVGGWRLTACAWWEGPETLADLERRLTAAGTDRPARWLWAFHGPPDGPLSWTGTRHYGDPELPRLLDIHGPDIVLCGHIHQAPFVDGGAWAERRGSSWLFNAGYQMGDRPTFVELDLTADRAYWWSSTGDGELDLRAQ